MNILDFPRMPNGQGRLCANAQATWQGTRRTASRSSSGACSTRTERKSSSSCPSRTSSGARPRTTRPCTRSSGARRNADPRLRSGSEGVADARSGRERHRRPRAHQPDDDATGTLTAFDVRTNKRIWHQVWDAPCISGSTNTASNLTFVGTTGGKTGRGSLQALNTATGALLWESPKMDAMATAPPMTYSVGGKQYVSIFVGGQNRDDPTGGVCAPARADVATTSTPTHCRN